jgi:PAS domain S-box-containing protein
MPVIKSPAERCSEVISLVTSVGQVLYISASSLDVFGYPPEEIVGRDSFELIHPGDRDNLRRAFGAVVANPSDPRRFDARVLRKDGERRRGRTTLSNLRAEPRTGAIVVNCREIGDRKAAKNQRHRQIDELVRTNARLEDFAYAVAHDLREPLRTISMFTELLLEEAQLNANGRMQAQFVVDGIARMSSLFEGLHGFAVRGFEDTAQVFDLGNTVAEVLKDLGHAIKASKATVVVDPLPVVQGNENHLARVFQNLIVNAIKYRGEAPVKIHLTAEQLGPEWIIKVKDNGIGIAPNQYERVFGLFKRLHGPETSGAGIGLAICKKIIEAMGGAIWVEPAPGSGSIFCFTIAAKPVAENDGGRSPADRFTAKILKEHHALHPSGRVR